MQRCQDVRRVLQQQCDVHIFIKVQTSRKLPCCGHVECEHAFEHPWYNWPDTRRKPRLVGVVARHVPIVVAAFYNVMISAQVAVDGVPHDPEVVGVLRVLAQLARVSDAGRLPCFEFVDPRPSFVF